MVKYNEAGIAGKFRMIHVAHRELVLRTIGLANHVHVFIVDVPTYTRYATISELKQTFIAIFAACNFENYTIHLIKEELSGEAWDLKVLELAPNIDVMFDSKEAYDNILVKNEFVELTSSKTISVSEIEKKPFDSYFSTLIAPEFIQYLTKKIAISGLPKTGKTTLAKKIAMLLKGRYKIFNINTAFERCSTSFIFFDEDPILTMATSGTTDDLNMEKQIKTFLSELTVILFIKKVKPTAAEQVLEARLLALYQSYKVNVKIIEATSYDALFSTSISYINKTVVEGANENE